MTFSPFAPTTRLPGASTSPRPFRSGRCDRFHVVRTEFTPPRQEETRMRGIHWLPGSVLSAFTPAVVPAMATVMRRAASAHYRRRHGWEQRDDGHLAPTGARRGADGTGRLVVLVAVALLVAGSSAQAKKKVLPPLCPDNRYVVSGAPLVIGGAALTQFVGIAGNSLTLGACAGGLKLKATKTGT